MTREQAQEQLEQAEQEIARLFAKLRRDAAELGARFDNLWPATHRDDLATMREGARTLVAAVRGFESAGLMTPALRDDVLAPIAAQTAAMVRARDDLDEHIRLMRAIWDPGN